MLAQLAGVAGLVIFWASLQLNIFDGSAHAYYQSQLGPELYARPWNSDPRAYVYPPAFRQIIEPATWLPWPVFYAAWTAILIACLAWLVGPLWAALLIIPTEPFQHAIATGDVGLLMAVALVLRPAAWAILPLLKVTPGVAFVWFAVRQEWRSLGIALGVTAAIMAVSVALGPELWVAWLGRMLESTTVAPIGLQVPVTVRLLIALPIIVIAAAKGWRWLLPVGVYVAMPNLTEASLVLLLAIPRLLVDGVEAKVAEVDAEAGGVDPHHQRVLV